MTTYAQEGEVGTAGRVMGKWNKETRTHLCGLAVRGAYDVFTWGVGAPTLRAFRLGRQGKCWHTARRSLV
jgi:hypothetical protein